MMDQGSLNDAVADKQPPPRFSLNDVTRGKHPRSVYALADCVVTQILVKEGQVVEKGQTLMCVEEYINEVQSSDAELNDSTGNKKRKVTHTEKRQMCLTAHIDYMVAKIYVTENQELKKWQQVFHYEFLDSEPNPSFTLPDDLAELSVYPYFADAICYPAIKEEATKPTYNSLISQDVDMMDQGSLSDAVDKQPRFWFNDITRRKPSLFVHAPADCVVTKILVEEGQVVKRGQTLMCFEEYIHQLALSDSPGSKKRKDTDTVKCQMCLTGPRDYIVTKIYVTENQELKGCQQVFRYEFLDSEPNPSFTLLDDTEKILVHSYSAENAWLYPEDTWLYPATEEEVTTPTYNSLISRDDVVSDVEVTKPTYNSLISRDVVSDVGMMDQGSLSDAVDKQQQPLYNWHDITHGNHPWSVYAPADGVVTKILVKEGQEVKKGEILMYLEYEAMEIKEEDSKDNSPSSTQSDPIDNTATSQVINPSSSQSPTSSESYKSKEEGTMVIFPSSTQSDSKDNKATSQVFSQPPKISESAKSKVIHTGKRQLVVTARKSYVVSKLYVSEKQEVKKWKPLFHFELTEVGPFFPTDIESIDAILLSDKIWTEGFCDVNFED